MRFANQSLFDILREGPGDDDHPPAPIPGYPWDEVFEISDRYPHGRARSWSGVQYVVHDATMEAHEAAMREQVSDVLTLHDHLSWGRFRGLEDTLPGGVPHPWWFISPFLNEETQRYVFQYKLDLWLEGFGPQLTISPLRVDMINLIQQFQDRMANVEAIREQIRVACELLISMGNNVTD